MKEIKFNWKSWKTLTVGIVGGLSQAGPQIVNCVQGEPCDPGKVALGIAIAALGYFSKDWDVTGGDRNVR